MCEGFQLVENLLNWRADRHKSHRTICCLWPRTWFTRPRKSEFITIWSAVWNNDANRMTATTTTKCKKLKVKMIFHFGTLWIERKVDNVMMATKRKNTTDWMQPINRLALSIPCRWITSQAIVSFHFLFSIWCFLRFYFRGDENPILSFRHFFLW